MIPALPICFWSRHVVKLYGLSFLCAGLLTVSFFSSEPSDELQKLLTSDGGSELCSFLLVRLAGCYRGATHAGFVVCIIAIWMLYRQRRKHRWCIGSFLCCRKQALQSFFWLVLLSPAWFPEAWILLQPLLIALP